MSRKITFKSLYRKFDFLVLKHFLISILRVILFTALFGTFRNLFQAEKLPVNYAELLKIPSQLWQCFSIESINKEWFTIIGIILGLFYAFVYYWDYLWEEELRIKGGHYTKNLLLNKFRRLPFEAKQSKKEEVNKLIESDSWEIGHYWEHLPNHIFHSALDIIVVLLAYGDNLSKMSGKQIFLSLFWLALLNIVTYFFTQKILHNEQEYKKRLDQEWAVINKERSQINLIENMGLTSQYKKRQKDISHANESLILAYSRFKSLSKAIPSNLLMDFYPFLLLFLSPGGWNGIVLGVFWQILGNFRGIFQCLWEYADYASSRLRINAFLTLPEKDDNLKGVKLSRKIAVNAIKFVNVSFRYAGEEEWIFQHYTHTFSPGKINSLRGKNGTGKSTKLYLLLGVIKPQEGKIIIELANRQTYDLHQDINLATWRAQNVAYCAHETLVEEGSTGQKQLANINNTLTQKKTAQIFLFDEADNALDKTNQEEMATKIEALIEKKIVIYIKH